jgi:hypothetical protein
VCELYLFGCTQFLELLIEAGTLLFLYLKKSIGLVHLVFCTVQIADSLHTQWYNRSTIHSFTLARKQLGFVGSGNVLAVSLNAVREAVKYIAQVH